MDLDGTGLVLGGSGPGDLERLAGLDDGTLSRSVDGVEVGSLRKSRGSEGQDGSGGREETHFD